MKPNRVKKIVVALGGPTKVATLCGMASPQAVSMWIRRRKIPQARLIYLKVVRPDVFEKKAA